ncbi:MAG: transposase [Candidatus Scalindua rubra]|uniref:Transposase n=1 Tax=Candidatus Scalindua rubra TaxID=1872076 RepID=A0A1E3X3D6_9BACT|nr:MAG: transposase [Candidatus Scalindua rubra]
MAYRYGNREQMMLLPPSIEDYVGQGDPVRAYDAFIEVLDFNKLGIVIDQKKVGNPEYNPKSMLKLLLYGYSYGFRSSRKLERATHHNISFIWLMGNLRPDHKTIAEFRRKNTKAIAKVLKQSARLCIDLGLIEGNTLFVDGSKFRANAGIKNTWTKERCEKSLKKIDARIEDILSECERVDKQEQEASSLVEMKEELQDKKVLKSKVEGILKVLDEGKMSSTNTTDPECTKVKGIQGTHAGYNVQSVVDEKHGLIVNIDVVSEGNDRNQFAEQINQANDTVEKKCEVACADAGYDNTDELKKIDDQDIQVIVPQQGRPSHKGYKSFEKESFKYDKQKDCYVCPEGHVLSYRTVDVTRRSKTYQITDSSLCMKCQHFHVCTNSKRGRRISRLINEEVRERLETQYEQPESQAVYKLRQQKVELPFGHMKRNLKANSFLMRGRDGAKAEASLLATSFNMARMITILGIPVLIEKLIS